MPLSEITLNRLDFLTRKNEGEEGESEGGEQGEEESS